MKIVVIWGTGLCGSKVAVGVANSPSFEDWLVDNAPTPVR
jgi:hypothetical protein